MTEGGGVGELRNRSENNKLAWRCTARSKPALLLLALLPPSAMPALDDSTDFHALLARDASRLVPNDTQRTTLIVAACYIIVIALLWCAEAR